MMKFFLNKALTLTLAAPIAVLMLSSSAFADSDYLEADTVGSWVQKQISKATIAVPIQFFDVNILSGVSLASQYRYQTEPSYLDNYYTRYDTWYAQAGIQPSSWIIESATPFSFGIAAGTNIVFARQFKSQWEASKAEAYQPWKQLPLSSKIALEKLNVGDFVSWTSNINIGMTVSDSTNPFGGVSLTGATDAILSGQFLIHVYKKDATKVRLKLIGVHSATGDIGVKLGFFDSLRLFALKVAHKQVQSFWQISLADAYKKLDISDVVMLDYVLDLSDPRAAKAYDTLFQQKFVMKAADIMMPTIGEEGGVHKDKLLITDFSEIEQLYREELKKDPENRKVDRLFKGSTITSSNSSNFGINLEFFRFEHDNYYAHNRITTRDSQERPVWYLFDMFSLLKQRRTWFNFGYRKETVNTNLLFASNKQFEPEKFESLTMSRELQTRTFDHGEIEYIDKHVRTTLPPSIFQKLPWNDWMKTIDHAENVYFHHQMTFPIEALIAMPVYDFETLKQRYADYLKSIPTPDAPYSVRTLSPECRQDPTNCQRQGALPLLDRYEYDIEIIAEQLAIAFNPQQSPGQTVQQRNFERYQAFVKLKDNKLFQDTGAGFLIRLLPEKDLENLVGYTLEISGNGFKKLDFPFGKVKDSELDHVMVYIQDVLNNRQVDLRLLRETSEPAPALPESTELR